MEMTNVTKVASLVISSVMIQTAVAGHAVGIGVGPRFGGGGFGGGIFGMLSGGGDLHSAPAFAGSAGSSFGDHPTLEEPVIVRSASRTRTSPGRLTITSRQRDPISAIHRQSRANSRLQTASRIRRRSERAGSHIFLRQTGSVHRYNNNGVYYRNRSPHPTVTAVQEHLTKLGYYHGPLDGFYGRATRDAVVRYQTRHHLAVTGTLTNRMLQLLRVSPET
jgi:Putative peptidoglycan binding domain